MATGAASGIQPDHWCPAPCGAVLGAERLSMAGPTPALGASGPFLRPRSFQALLCAVSPRSQEEAEWLSLRLMKSFWDPALLSQPTPRLRPPHCPSAATCPLSLGAPKLALSVRPALNLC